MPNFQVFEKNLNRSVVLNATLIQSIRSHCETVRRESVCCETFARAEITQSSRFGPEAWPNIEPSNYVQGSDRLDDAQIKSGSVSVFLTRGLRARLWARNIRRAS
ncbi:hypothetical protein J6590_039373 [Homalodisca vitripennis]|nr:hypothetical protein J6590_039373 [Homalodisca vitripennis]